MRLVAIDIGIKNFSVVIAKDGLIELAELHSLPSKYIPKMVDIMTQLDIKENDLVLIEKQLSKNVKCLRLEIAVEVYCIINDIHYKKIHPRDKYKRYNITFDSYYKRKKWVINIGEDIFKEQYNYSIKHHKKKDDLCDCIIMIHLEINKGII